MAFPLAYAHSHNDYEQEIPLFRALSAGFCSIEADVILVNHDKDFIVGHFFPTHGRLTDMYLRPIAQLASNYSTYPGPVNPIAIKTDLCQQSTLLIDFKSNSIRSWRLLETMLKNISDDAQFEVFQRFDSNGDSLPEPKAVLKQSPIRVVMSGISIHEMNELADHMAKEPVHRTLIDGRWSHGKIYGNDAVMKYIGMVSGRWRPSFMGYQLERMAEISRQRNIKMRFWKTPELETLWEKLIENNCIISTNEITRLQAFLLDNLSKTYS